MSWVYVACTHIAIAGNYHYKNTHFFLITWHNAINQAHALLYIVVGFTSRKKRMMINIRGRSFAHDINVCVLYLMYYWESSSMQGILSPMKWNNFLWNTLPVARPKKKKKKTTLSRCFRLCVWRSCIALYLRHQSPKWDMIYFFSRESLQAHLWSSVGTSPSRAVGCRAII